MQSSESSLFTAQDWARYRDLFQEAATLTVYIEKEVAVPLLHMQHESGDLLQGLKESLGMGSTYISQDYAYFEIAGVLACECFLRMVGDNPPFEGEMLRKFQVWKEMVAYLADTPKPSLFRIQRFLMKLDR